MDGDGREQLMASVSVGDLRSDEGLLAAMAAGDDTAGVAFVRRHQRRTFGLAMAILGDAAAAEDVAQEALIRVWRHAAVYDSRRASVTTWILTITRNLAIDAARLRRAIPIDPDDVVAMALVSDSPDPAELAQRSDTSARVRSVLRGIPAEQRRAVVLAAFYGMTANEIAEKESIPLGTAKTRIRLGLSKVRASLTEKGLPPVGEEQFGGRRGIEKEWPT
jgi:RNA polymerase sigma-70 factor (ECF subfamily)